MDPEPSESAGSLSGWWSPLLLKGSTTRLQILSPKPLTKTSQEQSMCVLLEGSAKGFLEDYEVVLLSLC